MLENKEIEDKVDRNQHVKTIQSVLGAKSSAIGSKELVEYFLKREMDVQIAFGLSRGKGASW